MEIAYGVKKYKLDLSYIGTNFYGWQSQKNHTTIQECIESVLEKILGQKVRILGASRTDSGVHARHQIATFLFNYNPYKNLTSDKLHNALMALLPKDIGINSVDEVSLDFHPIFQAKAKAYRYSMWISKIRNPFLIPYTWHVDYTLDIEQMYWASRILVGKHNFKSFCAADSCARTYERTIFEIVFTHQDSLLNIWFLGDGFLKQMIRNIVGTFVNVGLNKISIDDFKNILQSQDRKRAGITAPACGLCLEKIFYNEPITLRNLIHNYVYF